MADLITAEQRANAFAPAYDVSALKVEVRRRLAISDIDATVHGTGPGQIGDLTAYGIASWLLAALTTAEAEIERLKSDVTDLMEAANAEANEAEKLRADLAEAREAQAILQAAVLDRTSERDRLQAVLDRAAEDRYAQNSEIFGLKAERDALKAEVERLETEVKYLGVGDFLHQEEIAELIEDGAVTWLPISEAVPVERQSIIVCTADEPSIVGEAVWLSEDGRPLDLWWANTSPGDYYADPISQSNARVVAFRPMPEAPCAARLQSLTPPTQERAEP